MANAYDEMVSRVQVITHDSVRLRASNGQVVYIDPFGLTAEPHDADFVLVTHDHYDHYSPEDIAKVACESTQIVVPHSLAQEVAKLGMAKATALAPGDSLALSEAIEVEAVRSYNVGKKFHPRENDWLGYVVTLDGTRYFHMGDTDHNEDNEQVACDVLLVPVGGTYTMTVEEAVAYAQVTKPKVAIPMHYGSVVGKPEDGPAFAKLLEAAQAGEAEPIHIVVMM